RLDQEALEVRVEMLELGGRRKARTARRGLGERARGVGPAGAQKSRHPELVAHDLHGHREIERRERGVRRNLHVQHAARERLVREPRLLAPEHHRGAIPRLDRVPDPRGRFARIGTWPLDAARPCARADDERAVRNRIVEGLVHVRPLEQIGRAGRTRGRLLARERARRDEREIVEPHRFHRARARADVTRVRGFDENDADRNLHDARGFDDTAFANCHRRPTILRCAPVMHGMVNIGIRAARRAGELMIRQWNQLDALQITDKGRHDYVTQVDLLAEETIVNIIKDHYPDHAILAEERGSVGEHEWTWIIDPLDGTTNYLHGFPVFAVSIAVAYRGELQHAVVYDPLRQEIFTATRGEGALLDG